MALPLRHEDTKKDEEIPNEKYQIPIREKNYNHRGHGEHREEFIFYRGDAEPQRVL